MIDSAEIKKKLLDFGLKLEELNNLSLEQAAFYFRFFPGLKIGRTIYFLGFSKEETRDLTAIANKYKIGIQSYFSDKLTFVCASERVDLNIVENAEQYKSKFITKEDFEFLFKNELSVNFDFLYDEYVPLEYQIPRPLSNYDTDKIVNSLSFDSDNTYTINMYGMTCTCLDFIKKNRINYPKGDIRRMCKHLRNEYINNKFDLCGISPFKKAIIKNAPHFKGNFKLLALDDFQYPIVILYSTDNEWWDIFVPNKSGTYKEYSYSSLDNRFSYDNKPNGIVKILKTKFKEIHNELTANLEQRKTLDEIMKDFEIFVRKNYNDLWKRFKMGQSNGPAFDKELAKKINDEGERIGNIYKNEFGESKLSAEIQKVIFKVIPQNLSEDQLRREIQIHKKNQVDRNTQVDRRFQNMQTNNNKPQGCFTSIILLSFLLFIISYIISALIF